MAMVAPVFFDTTVLLAGLIDMGPVSVAPLATMEAIAGRVVKRPLTAWHCCLEFYSVATRLPPELRLSAADAVSLLQEEVVGRFAVVDLPATERTRLLQDAASDGVTGGRVYDLHIAETARCNSAKVVVTDNRRHFSSLLRYDIRVLSTAEFVAELRPGA
ncbi:MAG: PIN domain-containing protein [Candidatus Binatia bacterium]|jgi:predicted nucleic acid-binding protein